MNGRGHIHGHPSGPESPLNNEFLSRIKEMYGTFDEPNFSFVMEAIRSRPYEDVISEVVTTLGLAFEEYNDPNDDASFQYQLSRGSESWAVELSMLGPFAVVARIGDGWDRILVKNDPNFSKVEHQILAILHSHGLQPLSKEELEQPVPLSLFNTDPDNVCVYQALFSDIDVLPWRQ
jgi:hypothetical protein